MAPHNIPATSIALSDMGSVPPYAPSSAAAPLTVPSEVPSAKTFGGTGTSIDAHLWQLLSKYGDTTHKDSSASGIQDEVPPTESGEGTDAGEAAMPLGVDSYVAFRTCIADVVQALAGPDPKAKLEKKFEGQEGLDEIALREVICAVCNRAEEALKILDDPQFGVLMTNILIHDLAKVFDAVNGDGDQGGHTGITKRGISAKYSEKDKDVLVTWAFVSAGLIGWWALWKLLNCVLTCLVGGTLTIGGMRYTKRISG